MKVPAFRRINQGELGFFAPGWYDRVFGPIFNQLELITEALNGNLTFPDNFAKESQTLKNVKDGEEKSLRVKTRPRAVVIGEIKNNYGYDAFSWRMIDSEKVGVTVTYSTPKPPNGAEVKFVMF